MGGWFANDDTSNGTRGEHWPWHNGANSISGTKLNLKRTKESSRAQNIQ